MEIKRGIRMKGMGEGQGRDGKDGRMEAVEDLASRRAQEGCAPAAVLEL